MAATAWIFHHPDAIESESQPLAGRRIAGQSFLGGYVRHAQAETLHCFAYRPPHIEQFREIVAGHGWDGPVEGALAHEPHALGTVGTCCVPGPNLADFAWVRRRVHPAHYSLCGITHTVATRRVMEGLAHGLVAPVEPWDAIICTSRAVRSVVAGQFDAVGDYLRQRFATQRVVRPQLPVIPLGIDTARFAHDPAKRAYWRAALGLAEDTVAVLSMGRRSVAEKMHPAPLMIALQQTAERTGKRLALLMVGWFSDHVTEDLHRDAAEAFAPDVEVQFPDGKDAELRYDIWSAADIFALPVDNIQETFGLAPVEAMAAGLPVVCSDWDGFRDTVEDGVSGIRVPTVMARPGSGHVVGARFEDGRDSYLQYLLTVHQHTAVDIPALTDALSALATDPERRRRMGAAGAARARALNDWAAVIPQYQALWAELGAMRDPAKATIARAPDTCANPAALDPFMLYAQYPTGTLGAEACFRAAQPVTAARIDELVQLTGAAVYRRMVARTEELLEVHAAICAEPGISHRALQGRVRLRRGTLEGVLLWFLKFDLVQLVR